MRATGNGGMSLDGMHDMERDLTMALLGSAVNFVPKLRTVWAQNDADLRLLGAYFWPAIEREVARPQRLEFPKTAGR